MNVVFSAAVAASVVLAATTAAGAQSRNFSCDESSLTGPIVTVTIQGGGNIVAGPILGRTVPLEHAGARFQFINTQLGLDLTISQDQSRMTVRRRGETVHCSQYTGRVDGTGRPACPPGTRPVAQSDGACAPVRGGGGPGPQFGGGGGGGGGGGPGPQFGGGGQGDYLGSWRQTRSNSGACPSCSVTFNEAGGNRLVAVGSSGGSAQVAVDPGDERRLNGRGRWQRGAGGNYSGQPFTVTFYRARGEVSMTMDVQGLGTVEASYRR